MRPASAALGNAGESSRRLAQSKAASVVSWKFLSEKRRRFHAKAQRRKERESSAFAPLREENKGHGFQGHDTFHACPVCCQNRGQAGRGSVVCGRSLPGGARDSHAVCGHWPQTPGAQVSSNLNAVQRRADWAVQRVFLPAARCFRRVAGNSTRVACSTRKLPPSLETSRFVNQTDRHDAFQALRRRG